ncbi:MAG: ATP-binding cassette domain-containing protein [Kangiellaceae bacterium]
MSPDYNKKTLNHYPHKTTPCLNYSNTTHDQKITINQRKKVALLGLNGAGKSTFLRQLIGEINFPGTKVFYQENSVSEAQPNTKIKPESLEFKKRMGYQADTMLSLSNINVAQYLNLCAGLKGITNDQADTSIEKITHDWQLENILNKPLENLSKGNMQKAAIAQVFINKPDFLFFDEPCQSLDPLEQELFMHNIANLDQFSICMFSTHNVNHALDVADDIILIHQSKIAYFYEENNSNNFLMFSFEPKQKITKILDEEDIVYQNLENGLYKLNNADASAIKSVIESNKSAFEFCLPEKEALMPLFRLLASNEWKLA